MLANHPDLVKHVYGLLTMLSSRNKLPTRLRELIIMRLAWRAGCEYAWFQHYRELDDVRAAAAIARGRDRRRRHAMAAEWQGSVGS